MGTMLFHAHSGLRYLVLLLGVLAIAALLWQRYGAGPLRLRRIATAAFVGVLDIQVLLGIGLLFVRPFYGALAGHITMMVVALIVAHIYSVRTKREADVNRAYSLNAIAILAPLVLIVAGILAIGRSVV